MLLFEPLKRGMATGQHSGMGLGLLILSAKSLRVTEEAWKRDPMIADGLHRPASALVDAPG